MFFSAWRVKIYLEDVIHNASGSNDSGDNATSANFIPDEIWATRVGVFAIGGTAIACFGLLCNSISIVVLAHFRRKSSAPFLLICLEIVDSVLLLSEMFLETLATLSQAKLLSDSYRDFIRPVYVVTYPIPHIAQTGTTLLTVLITLERYVAVAKPLLASTVCSRTWARRVVLLIVLWSLVFHVPLYMAYTYDYQVHPTTNATKIVFHRTDFGRSHFYNYWFIVWINLVFEFIIPFILIVVFNVLMLRALSASRSLTLTSGKGGKNKRGGKLTGMVIAVTIIFFVCELFPAVALIIIRGKDAFAECSVACAHFVSVADTMVLLNSGVNFVAYCAIGKQFRDIFVRIFLRRRSAQAARPAAEKQSHSGLEDKASEAQLHLWKDVNNPGGENGHRFLHLHYHHHHHHHHHSDSNDCGERRGRSSPPPTRL
ncbi:hypothetical protein ACOMHN_045874 [Nucella lapillus]